MQRLLVFVFFSLMAATAVRAQLSISGGSTAVQESIGRAVTLTCTYSLSAGYTLREIKWYRVNGERDPVLFYYPGQSAYTYGLYRNRASLVNTDDSAQVASLRLSNLQFSDNGTYECLVGALNGQPAEESVQIDLVALVAPNDPVITDEYNNGNLTMTCTAYTGNPAANLTWTRDGSRVYHDVAENITSWRGYLDAQSIISVTASTAQSSTFQCVAQHPAFTAAQRASVTVGSPTVSTVNINPSPVPGEALQELDDIILTCMTQEGIVPQPTYQWTLDGGNVPASAQAYRNELKIFSAQVEDSGIYSCTARNDFGSDSGDATILIAERDTNIVEPQTGTPPGTVVGIVIAVLAVVAVIVVIGFVCWRRRQSDELKIPPDSPEEPTAVVSTEPEDEKDEEKLNLMEEKKEEEPEVKVETQGEGHAEVAKKPDPDQTA
ncbi:nectin-4-like isoform X1 [Branchiostoma floridae]|uniref:Nectin-4-like isoform X1 n=1 Tax=Branchiostoma floridae TaxID=7739 RepID=A0A9J7MUP3_BRAFL|nr:nectin-4-like isoform X1 [Branchiostoma floridae]